jgi:uncharacterized RDD family membrane protein YckC
MKCPKCGYLGFETTERCRHCGYDFSLPTHVPTSLELPLRGAQTEAPLADFDLSRLGGDDHTNSDIPLDLDRVIGEIEPVPNPAPFVPSLGAASAPTRRAQPYSPAPGRDDDESGASALPLFTHPASDVEEQPLITPPRPARPPLAVRRATPEVARRRTPRTIRRNDDDLALQLEPSREEDDANTPVPAVAPARPAARLASALIDMMLLGAIDAAVLYLTLAIAGLSFADVRVIPTIPMAAFLLLLNGGYLVGFTAANGQTIGKMLTNIRVVGRDGGRVDVAGAVVRATGVLLSLIPLGLPYVVVFASPHRRALHDRLAGTRVVKNA